MPKISYILTEEEYNDLLKVQSHEDDLLRETNNNLKFKIAKLEKESKETPKALVIDRANSPFKVVGDTMSMSTDADFVMLYNSISINVKAVQLRVADTMTYEYLCTLATSFGYNPFFKDMPSLKQYRVSLGKKYLYKSIKKDLVIQLAKVETNDKQE